MPSFFQIQNLFADRQTDLESHLPQRNVLTRERPIQDRHRTSEHPFDRFVGKTLRIFRIEHGDRVFASDITEDDRRLDASCSVGLYPGFFGKYVSSQVFAEEFNHVVALGFAVDQHIQPQFLLQIDAFFDEAFDVFIVFGSADVAFAVFAAVLLDFPRLREGTDRRCRQQTQLQFLLLDRSPFFSRNVSDKISFRQARYGCLHVLVFIDPVR